MAKAWKVIIVLLCCAFVVCALVYLRNYRLGQSAKDDVALVIDGFMQAMARKDISEAYSDYSTRGRQVTAQMQLDQLAQESFYLFSGYQSFQLQDMAVQSVYDTNPDMPQGTVANIYGVVTYGGNHMGEIRATLERHENKWGLYGIQIIVQANKVGDSQ